MKRYVPIIIGVVALCGIIYVGSSQMRKSNTVLVDEQKSEVSNMSFQGKVTKIFEGENVLEYGFNLPENATATVTRDGALVTVSEADSSVLEAYFSYEGARGYSPSDYITNVIVPQVKAVTEVGTTTIGSHDWTVVESEWSVWHVAKSANGQWLLVIENKKTDNEKVAPIIKSILTK